MAHYYSTGPEIFEQTNGNFDVFMCGVGTGGTISGTGMYLKEKMPNVKIVGVDIEGSILLPFFKTGKVVEAKSYVLEGIGEDIFPDNLDFSVLDDMVLIRDKESFIMTRHLLTKEGIYTGGSGGATIVGAIRYAEQLTEPKKILVILPDSGNRYTGKIYNDDWMRNNGYWDNTFNVTIQELIDATGRKNMEIISITDENTVSDAVKLLKQNNISQIPVYSKGNLMGIVNEKNVLRSLFESKISLSDNVSIAVDSNFEVVNVNDFLDKVADSLLLRKTVLVEKSDKIIGIITDIDVLNFMSSRNF